MLKSIMILLALFMALGSFFVGTNEELFSIDVKSHQHWEQSVQVKNQELVFPVHEKWTETITIHFYIVEYIERTELIHNRV
ncbi:hypothetical protein EJB05_14111 [Eragrostis curvula]|uniref:Cystatin domain-containing protein n=1 Tax=Eragrostis curvula TaxID=38414 RepID=A0A5J9VW35_9POAL|nr:hypothetical protein EJB05_14111 [Eragrostis curvula]